jgi:hypothetical protein
MENFTLEQLQNAVDVAIGGKEYGKAYRAFRYALAEAHANLTLDDIVDLIQEASEEFAENHICTCCTENEPEEAAKGFQFAGGSRKKSGRLSAGAL